MSSADKKPLLKKERYKQIQAGQDWSDPYTWYGLVLALLILAPALYAVYKG